MIVRAAVQIHLYTDGRNIIIPLHRHVDAMQILSLMGYTESMYRRDMDGFLTEDGRFLDRCEAADYAYECGQLIETAEEPRIEVLFSEDLWQKGNSLWQ